MFSTVMVANRGEIARRVFRTCRRMGLRTVAVHTDLDAEAPHVREADAALRVESYLDVEEMVAAAVAAGADAVHPGYGFLSERAAFATALEAAGVTLVGPTAAVMEQMGRKDAARELAVAAGVPVVPAYDLDDDPASWTFPVLVKAAAGGGGKGMRVVRSADGLAEAVAAARREAASAFGDDTLLVERYVERGRHVEVQVVGDTHGTVIHLGERDCSPQRRHQKVLEEAPAPTLDEATRQQVRQSAVDLAAHVGYTGAGTVELLLDADSGDFYFLEMNTRLQVEHPVTEMVTGLDLVELQLRVAAGEPLPVRQDDVRLTGHAIEARVYAEDAYAGFLPQAGTATHVRWPEGPGVRVDHALESGQVVSTAYDPMLGKVVAHGRDRAQARQRLVEALDGTAVLGLTTNAGFLRALAASEEFADAAVDTAWLDRHELPAPDPGEARRLAAWAAYDAGRTPSGPWRSDGFRLGGPPAEPVVHLDEPVRLAGPAPAGVVARVTDDHVEVVAHGQRFDFPRPDPFADPVAVAGDGTVLAPMPGTVLDVRVAEGDQVGAGQVLGVMEAMKMELSLTADVAGTVDLVGAAAGDRVQLGAVLFRVVPDE
ncbi:acetyl/propionyl/methylcrotonyl-CoA carboxylase subunit alpha [Nocardioides aequoreus]|uniref:acetyl/propionyl/methylcrotonyl-CoA carboxylase subunit alpha n=1 Tax=Nocardioides aequoreus TaxID=397278 RepID=UPI0004C30DD6|nr:biotin carboxylase N-terminal domain-containing protein [Nocardioides aequoreus]